MCCMCAPPAARAVALCACVLTRKAAQNIFMQGGGCPFGERHQAALGCNKESKTRSAGRTGRTSDSLRTITITADEMADVLCWFRLCRMSRFRENHSWAVATADPLLVLGTKQRACRQSSGHSQTAWCRQGSSRGTERHHPGPLCLPCIVAYRERPTTIDCVMFVDRRKSKRFPGQVVGVQAVGSGVFMQIDRRRKQQEHHVQ